MGWGRMTWRERGSLLESFDSTAPNVGSMKFLLRLLLIVLLSSFIISAYAASIVDWHPIGIAMAALIMTMGVIGGLVMEHTFNRTLDKIQIFSEGIKPFSSVLRRIRGIRFIERESIDSIELKHYSYQANENSNAIDRINTIIMIRKKDNSNILVGIRSKKMANRIARKINDHWMMPVIETYPQAIQY